MTYERTSTRLMTWNIKSGGFSAYDPDLPAPEREHEIKSFIQQTRAHHDVTSTALVDTFRWSEVYGGDEGIARHLGFAAARFTLLNDERLMQGSGGQHIGVTLATDERIEDSWPLDLDTRQGLAAVLDIGNDGLQIATIYLDDLDEDKRLNQMMRALGSKSNLRRDVPTVLAGDFNALRPNLKNANLPTRIKDMVVRGLARASFAESLALKTIADMNRRTVVPYIQSMGYRDADALARPTFPAPLPAFGVDYVFHDNNVEIEQLEVMQPGKASDHRALVAVISV